MHVRELVAKFDMYENMPIEIAEVQEVIVEMCLQERVIVSAQALDPQELKGAYYRYTQRPSVYGEPERVSLIIYCNKLSLEWQRLVCCKEAVHIFDATAFSPTTIDQVLQLADSLVGPLSTDEYGLPELMASTDRLAIYHAAAVLFPDAAREEALQKIQQGVTPAEIADWVMLPIDIVTLVLHHGWPQLKADMLK